jgi:LysM repeat protein
MSKIWLYIAVKWKIPPHRLKYRLISTSSQDSFSFKQVGFQKMTKKWLKTRLIIISSCFVLFGLVINFSFYTPVSAGVFSFMEDLLSSKASAAIEESSENIQNMALLQSNLNPSSTPLKNDVEVIIVDGSALLTESGVEGTFANIEESHSSQISLYVVRRGDSLSEIAKMFGVSVNTIKWANDISGSIREGDKLVILPVSGVNYTISKGDTLQAVAKKFKADLDEIIKFNDIKLGETLAVGTKIIIPDGEIQTVVATKATSKLRGVGGIAYEGYYTRPIVGGRKSQGLHGYNGVDIASSIGTPITASANGTVIVVRPTGYNGGYGKYIVITHPNGTQTLYAHMNSVSVVQGQTVAQGDVIGTLGNTGKSTGPHIHFEIRGAKNPF